MLKPWNRGRLLLNIITKFLKADLLRLMTFFINHEGSRGHDYLMLIEPFWCLRQRFNDWNSTEWSSVTLLTVFSHIYRAITSQQFCHAERSKTNWIGWRRNSRIWVYPHPDDHTNHTTQSIHNKTTDMSCAVRVYVLVLNCHRCPVRVKQFCRWLSLRTENALKILEQTAFVSDS